MGRECVRGRAKDQYGLWIPRMSASFKSHGTGLSRIGQMLE